MADEGRHKKLLGYLNWPDEWVSPRENGLHFPKSGAYETNKVLDDLNEDQPYIHATIHDIKYINSEWHLFDINANLIIKAENIIYCGGMAGCNLPFINDIPLVPNRGQIDLLPVEHCEGFAATTVTYGGYITPASQVGSHTYRACGASFTRQIKDNWQEPSHFDTNKNIARLETHFHLDEMTIPRDKTITWTGLRATTIDHLPIVGPMLDRQQWLHAFSPFGKDTRLKPLAAGEYLRGLYIMTGFGSKGMQNAPICAEYLASLIASHPLPVGKGEVKALHPGRFLIKDISRNKVS